MSYGVRLGALIGLVLASDAVLANGFAWQAPATCPTADDVLLRIERRLGDGTIEDVGEIAVVVSSSSTGFAAEIDTRAISVAGRGRRLTATRCEELADAVAVVVARLASDARGRRIAPPVSSDAIFGIALELPRLDPPPAIATTIRVEHVRRWGGGIRVVALSGIGLTPRVGLGGELAGFVRRDAAFVELGYTRWAEQSSFLAEGAPARVDVGAQTVGLRGGWASSRMPVRSWLGVELGSMSGRGVALDDPRGGSSRWTAVAAGLGVGWPFARIGRLVGAFELAVPFERPRFALVDGTEIFQPSPVSARCSVGLELGWR